MTTDKMQPLDEGSGNIFESESTHLDPLTTTVASAVSGGVAGAAIGQLLGGRQGAAIGAVLGGVAGLAFHSEFSHTEECDRNDAELRSAEPSDPPQAIEADRDRSGLMLPATDSAIAPANDRVAEPTTSDEEFSQFFHLEQNYEISAETHYQLGVALGRKGKILEAIEEFQEALELAPESAETHYNLGVALSKQGDMTHGLEHMQQARDLCLAQGNSSGVRVIERAIQTLALTDADY